MKRYLLSFGLLFILTSVFGFWMETIGMRIAFGEWSKRGFLSLPLLPIYGIGSVAIAFFLGDKHYSLGKNFLIILVTMSLFEFYSSVLLEKVFHQTWWDYQSYRFNLDGRIALWSSIGFAFGGAVVLRYIFPVIYRFCQKRSLSFLCLLTIPILLATAADFIYSSLILLR